ncbi:hypothetical protein DPMN_061730 [Dreissena polymorpha]|uniref:Uncharacterized protein n=1 Tax=Dreissena polymorpha TaxID=45954 RepID=A0A9D4C8H1_DREPO|nr:hypothetical protein DPMN_061730 [Dreissena polymorpha]
MMLRMWGTSMTQKEITSIDIELAKQQHHTPFDSQPEVNQNSNSALYNICEASILAQLLSFRENSFVWDKTTSSIRGLILTSSSPVSDVHIIKLCISKETWIAKRRDPQSVIMQSDPQMPFDKIKPFNQKHSLLQQLLPY